MLQLSCKDAFTVHVGDLLDLEGTFKASGILETTAHEQKTLLLMEDIAGQCEKLRVQLKNFFDLSREGIKAENDLMATVSHGNTILAQLQGNQDESNKLASISLGAGYANFRAGIDMNTAMGLARDAGSDRVGHTNAERASFETVAQGKESIGGLSGLAHKDADVISEYGSLAIEEVTCKLDGNWNLGEFLENSTSGEAAVEAGTASDENETAAATNGGEISLKATKLHATEIKVHTSTHGVDNGLGLLKDFLLHEMAEVALHDLSQFHFKSLNGAN